MIDLVEEEEEEEWPEAGVQNTQKRQNNTHKRINNVFDHLSALIHQDTKDCARLKPFKNFKKIGCEAVAESMGNADVDVVLQDNKRPNSTIPTISTFDGRGQSRWWTPLKSYHDRP